MILNQFIDKRCIVKATEEEGTIIKAEHRRGKNGLSIWFIIKIDDEEKHYEARPDQVTIQN